MGLNTINHTGQRLLTDLTATGTDGPTAFPLVNGISFHEFTTVASSTGAILPVGRLPSLIFVVNAGAQTLTVYPPAGGTIDGAEADATVSILSGASGHYWASTPLTWYTA